MIIHRTVTALLLLSFTLTCLRPPVAGAQETPDPGTSLEKPRSVIALVGGDAPDDETWSIVRRTTVEGRVIVVSHKVGPEIDLAETNYYSIFQGETAYESKLLGPIQAPVIGFKTATFIQLPDSTLTIKITYGFGDHPRIRAMRVRDAQVLVHLRNYLDHFEEIRHGAYKLRRKTDPDSSSRYPLYTDQKTTFEEVVPLYRAARRTEAVVTTKDERQIRGQIIPTFDGESILLETDVDTQRIPAGEVAKIQITSSGGNRALANGLRGALSGAVSGVILGSLIAWQNNTSVGEGILFGAAVLGGAGLLTGLMSGRGGGGPRGGEFTLGPVKGEPNKGKKDPEG